MSDKTIAASFTVLVMGPTVSFYDMLGITPARETSPTVGSRPTTPLFCAGWMMSPQVLRDSQFQTPVS
jgi:hypothetical protein